MKENEERGRGYLRDLGIQEGIFKGRSLFDSRKLKLQFIKIFFFGERYEILRETSDGASRRGKELRLIKISTLSYIFYSDWQVNIENARVTWSMTME